MQLVSNMEGSTEELERYTIHSRREIIALMRSLADRRPLLQLQMDDGKESMTTSVVGVDDNHDAVYIDSARNATVNTKISGSKHLAFETVLDNIRILFLADRAQACEYDGLPAFSITLPDSVIRLQRREYFRVPTPVINPVQCKIHVPKDGSTTNEVGLFPLQNVSGGGIAIVDENRLLDNTIGRIYADCRIDLPGGTLLIASLEIRNSRDIKLSNGKTIRRLGCLFVDLPAPMMAAIQRYITKLEREQNARNKGIA